MSVLRPSEQPELFQLESHYAKKARRTRLYFAVALIAASAITAVVAILVTRGSTTTATRPPQPIRANGTNTSVAPTAPVTAATPPAVAASPGSDADMTTMTYDGATLPVSRSSGPRNVHNGLASGFVETPLGAALAAVHIGYRLDPAAGASVYVPTAQNQTIGDSAGLITQLGETPVAPKTGAPSEYVGYAITDYSVSEVVTVHLEAVQPGTTDGRDVPVNVEWLNGDWKIVLPLPTSVGPLAAASTYTRF